MNRVCLAFLLSATVSLPAAAAPWTFETYEQDGIVSGQAAYQWLEGPEDYLLAYQCDADWGDHAIFIQTPEPYDTTASYAPEVPTVFTIDGVASEHSGSFQQQDGLLLVHFNLTANPEMVQQLLGSRQSIEVAYFDKRLRFSGEGAETALTAAREGCGF
jgi:hypothetical protein